MSLVAVREAFIKYSGRYDLVVDTVDWEDNGADFYIRAGQKWLDATYLIGRSKATYYATIGAGGWYAIIPSARVIYEAWLSNTTNVRWELERKNLAGLRDLFPGSIADSDRGRAQFYAPIHLRNVPEVLNQITVDDLGETAYTVAGEIYSYNGLLFGPPTEEQVQVEVNGLFYQPPLVDDDDVNYWSEELEHVLVKAACRELESKYRNKAGREDYEEAIRSDLLGLEFDLADSESQGISQMEG